MKSDPERYDRSISKERAQLLLDALPPGPNFRVSVAHFVLTRALSTGRLKTSVELAAWLDTLVSVPENASCHVLDAPHAELEAGLRALPDSNDYDARVELDVAFRGARYVAIGRGYLKPLIDTIDRQIELLRSLRARLIKGAWS